jgi:hypothetical protein
MLSSRKSFPLHVIFIMRGLDPRISSSRHPDESQGPA